tara:strand:- start:4171 stop:5028 length:858 start_codon:yes stop_codon:yes gene_type:complete
MNIEDIRQGKEGDCFILSSILSILSSLGELYVSNIINEKNNEITFNYYIKNNDIFEKNTLLFLYNEKEFNISSKNKDWVKKIEYGYIKQFYNNDISKLLNEGGIAFNVLENLTGYKSKIVINRLFDNKTQLYYEVCKETIINSEWKNDFIKYLDILFKKYPTLLIQKIWRILTNNIENNNNVEIIPNNIYKINCPCVIGINGHLNNIDIPGIISEHLYSVVGISIDEYNNKYLHVINPHYNVDARQTLYDNMNNNFTSNIVKSRYGIWSFNEIIMFMSDITYSQL